MFDASPSEPIAIVNGLLNMARVRSDAMGVRRYGLTRTAIELAYHSERPARALLAPLADEILRSASIYSIAHAPEIAAVLIAAPERAGDMLASLSGRDPISASAERMRGPFAELRDLVVVATGGSPAMDGYASAIAAGDAAELVALAADEIAAVAATRDLDFYDPFGWAPLVALAAASIAATRGIEVVLPNGWTL